MEREDIKNELIKKANELSLAEIGFFKLPGEGEKGLRYGISLVMKLSDFVADEVEEYSRPTHSYFHHYRAVNAHLDRAMLELGALLERYGYRYLPIGASQSIPTEEDPHGYHGRFSHKKGACLAGLGAIGMSGLFLHSEYGPRVRLGTLLCDFETTDENPPRLYADFCGGCRKCFDACPAGAITGKIYSENSRDFELVNPAACSRHMKEKYRLIGRGAVCGICMSVCPAGKKRIKLKNAR